MQVRPHTTLNQAIVSSGLFGARMSQSSTMSSSSGFRVKLENHLTDVRQGRSWRSDNVYHNLRHRHAINREVLAGVDATAYQQYLGLMSGMTYTQQARIAATVHEMSSTIMSLRRTDAIP